MKWTIRTEDFGPAYPGYENWDRQGAWVLVKCRSHSIASSSGRWSLYRHDPLSDSSFPYDYFGDYTWYGNEKIKPPTTWANGLIRVWDKYHFGVAKRDAFRFEGRIIDLDYWTLRLPEKIGKSDQDHIAEEMEATARKLTSIFGEWRRKAYGGSKVEEPPIDRIREYVYKYDALFSTAMAKIDIDDLIPK